MSDNGFPRYDRANVPDSGCPQCEALRREVKLTREKNARLRNEVRWLQGLPPKNTNQQIAQRDRQIRALQSTCETYKSSVAGCVKHTATLAATIDRVKRERGDLRARAERLAEENERLRGLLAESLAEIHRAASIHADKILAITLAPAPGGEGEPPRPTDHGGEG